jgi:hypothetical protein
MTKYLRAKGFDCYFSGFKVPVVIRFTKLLSKSLYWALCGLYTQHSATIKKNTETMADAMEIAPNECPPTPPARRSS